MQFQNNKAMKKQFTKPNIWRRLLVTYYDIAYEGITCLLAALISIFFYGPYGMWKTYCEYENLLSRTQKGSQLEKDINEDYNEECNYYTLIILVNVFALTAVTYLIAKYI